MRISASCSSETGRPEEALEVLRNATRLDPKAEMAFFYLGQALSMTGKGEQADAAFEASFELNPQRRKLALAAEHHKAGRHDEAERLYRELLGSFRTTSTRCACWPASLPASPKPGRPRRCFRKPFPWRLTTPRLPGPGSDLSRATPVRRSAGLLPARQPPAAHRRKTPISARLHARAGGSHKRLPGRLPARA